MTEAYRERFLAKTSPEPNSGCWLWCGAVDHNGYGTFKVGPKTAIAHRFAYEMERGPIPADMHLDHLCSTRACVNPDHLEPVTHLENVRRTWDRGRGHNGRAQWTHCINGHPFSEENTFNNGRSRQCRQCKRERDRARYAERLGRAVRKCKRKSSAA